MAENDNDNSLIMNKLKESNLSRAIANILEPARVAAKSSPAVNGESERDTTSAKEPQESFHMSNDKILELPKTKPSSQVSSNVITKEISLESINHSPFQTRDIQGDQELESLVNSIREKGLLQPISVRRHPVLADKYELIAGERRLRAARLAGLEVIPARIFVCSDRESAEFSIIENALREDLNPIEEALAYQTLSEQFKLTQKEVGDLVGKSRVAITNSLRLLGLEPEVVEMLKTGELSAGHGRALLAVGDKKLQLRLAHRVVTAEMSVRALESVVAHLDAEPEESSEEDLRLRAQIDKLQDKIRALLDLETASLSIDQKGRRKLQLTFETEAAWRRFMSRIK